MGKSTKYTPEFLRSLLTWEGEACAMPGCENKWRTRLASAESNRAQWHLCVECWPGVATWLCGQQEAYTQARWRVAQPPELSCYLCDSFGEHWVSFRPDTTAKLEKIVAGKEQAHGIEHDRMRSCPEHEADLHRLSMVLHFAPTSLLTIAYLERRHYQQPTWACFFELLAHYSKVKGFVTWQLHRDLLARLVRLEREQYRSRSSAGRRSRSASVSSSTKKNWRNSNSRATQKV